jgi:hypothetical protein
MGDKQLMSTTKKILDVQVTHINELLAELGVDMNLSIQYAYGQPRILSNDSSNVSMRESKPNLDATIYAIKNILYEIGRVQRLPRNEA